MSHKIKKLAAASLAIVCAASMCGCSDSGYIGTVNGIQIPNGMYIFYVAVNGYSEAANKITDELGDSLGTAEVTVFNNTIEGKTASAWLKDHAVEKLRRYAAIEELFTNNGLSLTAEEQTAIDENIKALDDDLGFYAQYYGLPEGITSFGEHYESMGIGKSSLRLISENSYKEDHVFLNQYDVDGLTPVTDDEINSYITENYAAVKLLKLTFTDYQGITLKDEADIQAVKDLAQAYADRYNSTGDWSEIQYDFDLRQAQFDAWLNADDEYAEMKDGSSEATDTSSAAESQSDTSVSTAEAQSGTAEAAPEETGNSSGTIFQKPVVNTGDAEYNKFAQDAIDAATAELKDVDSLEQFIKKDSSTLPEKITEYIWNAPADGKATLFTDEESNCIYVVVRDDATTMESWKTSQHESFLHELRDDAFEELLKGIYQNYVVDLDDYLVNTKYAPEKLRGIGE